MRPERPSKVGGPRPVWPGLVGGRYQPLTGPEMERIHRTVLDVMEQIGFADAIPSMVERGR
jgi:trimethylamine--corrinoid protein Co-methyltransferase